MYADVVLFCPWGSMPVLVAQIQVVPDRQLIHAHDFGRFWLYVCWCCSVVFLGVYGCSLFSDPRPPCSSAFSARLFSDFGRVWLHVCWCCSVLSLGVYASACFSDPRPA